VPSASLPSLFGLWAVNNPIMLLIERSYGFVIWIFSTPSLYLSFVKSDISCRSHTCFCVYYLGNLRTLVARNPCVLSAVVLMSTPWHHRLLVHIRHQSAFECLTVSSYSLALSVYLKISISRTSYLHRFLSSSSLSQLDHAKPINVHPRPKLFSRNIQHLGTECALAWQFEVDFSPRQR